jgi:hypothetical protein
MGRKRRVHRDLEGSLLDSDNDAPEMTQGVMAMWKNRNGCTTRMGHLGGTV